MKKSESFKKLSLNKETIAKLNDQQKNAIIGGNAIDSFSFCATLCVWKCISDAGTCGSGSYR